MKYCLQEVNFFTGKKYFIPLYQACQTQTTSRTAKATKTAKGAAEMRLSGPHFTKN